MQSTCKKINSQTYGCCPLSVTYFCRRALHIPIRFVICRRKFSRKSCFFHQCCFSPQSGGCSTDSAGSSLSIDGDGEPWGGDDSTANESSLVSGVGTGRYCHSITPDEPAIMEENSDDYGQWNGMFFKFFSCSYYYCTAPLLKPATQACFVFSGGFLHFGT